ncbi:DUF1254 domain-containing protein [Dactylosporangium maewongense]|uniref:DUF1254 domain-containing protein n=1 Tax=Dactylosporangium maewongense TaxID=634393 RepID=UPI0031CF6DEE
MGPEYRSVVAINDDTLYSSAFVDLRNGPVILTIPSTDATYSLSRRCRCRCRSRSGTCAPTSTPPPASTRPTWRRSSARRCG